MRLGKILLCLAASPFLVNASNPVRLQPSSDWVVDFADNSCRISRLFGEGSRQVKLSIESYGLANETMVAVGRPLLGMADSENVATRFLPTQAKPFYGRGAVATDGTAAVYWGHVPFAAEFKHDGKWVSVQEMMHKAPKPDGPTTAAELAKQREDRKVFIETSTAVEMRGSGADIALETGPLPEVMKAFDECGRDLLKTLGLDPDVQDRIVTPPGAANPAAWFNPDIYPKKRLARGETSDVTLRVVVDASGGVSRCDAFSQFDAPEFNSVVCSSVKQNAKFYPAQLADGTRVPSYFIQQITFRLDDG